MSAHPAIWLICAGTLGAMLVRPLGVGEWVWALGGAVLLILARVVSPGAAFAAIAGGADVYLFLAGMMVLAETARREGVFDWLASLAAQAARGSATRLFALVYGVGVAVTVVLSNDATAVVLTPAVAAAARRARVSPLPYVLSCAFVANAASFVLPISNPANLIVFGRDVPQLAAWLGTFLLPSVGAIAVTFGVLRWLSRSELGASAAAEPAAPAELSRSAKVSLAGVTGAALALVTTSALRGPIGTVTCAAALVTLASVACAERSAAWPVLRSVSWSILALVAGLFVLVAGLQRAGGIDDVRLVFASLARGPAWLALGAVAAGTALITNVTNNLPLGAIAGAALARASSPAALRAAATIGIDLGPNLSVNGSLATILWLAALRREGIAMSGVRFLRAGAFAMPAALIAAIALLAMVVRVHSG